MQSEDDLRALSKILSFLRAVSIIILLLHIYWFCYSLFIPLGLTHPVIDKILLGFNAKASLFVYPIYTKLFSILLLGLSLLENKGVKNHLKENNYSILYWSITFLSKLISSS
ncbi:YWFCY domain-containing protein [Myroides odoratimimus]|uniref:YWFCY domain-containing protein n=1 Tax=Myroides odoratimimus TaxID=76832 RepID=UPI002576D0FB|nr:YWFCY domain-containing protein [Myroides odoratimimus]MDM1033750.1 YWFCY domain-containing protein [Myroides odoratimimus]MDM1457292.1 YWFCY domain-containing protein [Myroides odoratimimus]